MRMALKSIVVIPLPILVLTSTITIDSYSLLTALAASSPIDHQEVRNNNYTWTLMNVSSQKATLLPDGPKIYYKAATNFTQCKGNDTRGNDIISTLPNIRSISYFSDGETLNSTFWLSKAPLINHLWQNKSEQLKIDQTYLILERFPGNVSMTPEQLIENEEREVKKRYPKVNVTNGSDITDITETPDKSAAKIFFNGIINDTTFGYRNITGFDEITGIDNQFYRSISFADTNASTNETQIAEMTRSFQILSSTDNQTEARKTNLNNNSSTVPLVTNSSNDNDRLYNNSDKGITLKYPSEWGYYEYPNRARTLFYSPIDFYFMGTSYVILVDVPSSYDGPTDFISKVIWWHKFLDGKWAKIIEEASTAGPTRTLEAKYNFTEFFKKKENWEGYVFMPISLRTINSPNEYLMVFLTGATYVLNGLLCDMFQSTDTVSSPPPKLSILLSPNSTSIDPSFGLPFSLPQEKSIEVMVKSFSDIPYTISLKNHNSTFVNTSFSDLTLKIPPSGWVTTQLNIKADWKPKLTSPSKIETIPINANTTRSQLTEGIFFSFENKDMNISRPAAISRIEGSALTITAYSWADYFMNIVNVLRSPVSVLLPLAAAIGGVIVWFLKRETDKKGNQKADTASSRSDSSNNNV